MLTLPAALRPLAASPHWVTWRWVTRAGGRRDKPPFNPRNPDAFASTRRPDSWAGFDLAAAAVARNQADGVGYVLLLDERLIALDLDDCRDPRTGALEPWAIALVEEADSYTEITPSGTGLRILGLNESIATSLHHTIRKEPGQVEIYHRCPRFITVTGTRQPDTPDALRPICDLVGRMLIVAQRREVGAELFPPRAPNPDAAAPIENITAALAQIPNVDVAWDDWSRIGMAVWRASGGSSDGLAAWSRWSAKSRKHLDGACEERWQHWFQSPPSRIGFGTLYHLARAQNPLWVPPTLTGKPNGSGQHGSAPTSPTATQHDWDRSPGSTDDRTTAPAAADWPEPVNFLSRPVMAVALAERHVPEPILSFAHDTARRMGTAPIAVALAAIVTASAAISDAWQVQPKQHDPTWVEEPRLWGAIVGPPSVLKSPILRATTAPLDHLEAEATRRHAEDMRRYKAELKRWKAEGSDPETEPTAPRLARWLVENATVEAISEVLRTDGEGRFTAPARKILIRQDELSEWVANLDRYRQGGRGGGDRGAYLRLFNGGRFVIDRVQRGAFAVPNWSACLLGGIQPEVIARIAQEAADDGLLQRFLFAVVAQTEPGEDRAPDAAALERYRALIPALTALNPPVGLDGSVRAVTLAADAHRHRHAVDRLARMLMLLPNGSSRRQAAAGKLPGIFARLALAFHLVGIADARARGAEHPPMTVVRPETAAMAAVFLTEIAIPNMLAADEIMFGSPGEADAEWIAGFVLAQGVERLTIRQLVQNRHAFRAPERRPALLAALEAMVAFGWLEAEPHPPHADPSAWTVNPLVHERFRQTANAERDRRQRLRRELERLRAETPWLEEEPV